MKLLGVKEVAQRLGVTPITIYTWVKEGNLPYLRLDRKGKIFFLEDQLEKWLKEKQEGGEENEEQNQMVGVGEIPRENNSNSGT